MKMLLALVLLVVFAGAPFYLPEINLWDAQKQLKSVVKSNLKDPGSAEFKDVTLSIIKGDGCGYVNAKNALGGYIGHKKFVVVGGMFFMKTLISIRDNENIYNRLIRDNEKLHNRMVEDLWQICMD